MKDFDHPNILNLVGVCFDTPDEIPFIILPLMANGSLKDYLMKKRAAIKTVQIQLDTLPEVILIRYLITKLPYLHLNMRPCI